MTAGPDNTFILNNKHNQGWTPQAFEDNGVDRLVRELTNPDGVNVGTLYMRIFSRPNQPDSDGDGVGDFDELFRLESTYSARGGFSFNNFDLNAVAQSNCAQTFNPNLSNSENFCFSDPLNSDTDGNGIDDGAEDADGDFLRNSIENGVETFINVADSDRDPVTSAVVGDGIPDGIEQLLLGTDPSAVDSDTDGINDVDEMRYSFRQTNEACLAHETALLDIAGASYCFNFEYVSYPNRIDSDYDSVNDAVDAFPLDPNCSENNEGYRGVDDYDPRSCYATWLAQQDDLSDISFGEWQDSSAEDRAEFAFFEPGWPRLLRFDVSPSQRGYLPELNGAVLDNLVKVEYAGSLDRLYLVYDFSGTLAIDWLDLETDTVNTLVPSLSLSGRTLSEVMAVGNALVIELAEPGGLTDWLIYASDGSALNGLDDSQLSLSGAVYDASRSRIVAPVLDANLEMINVAYVALDGAGVTGSVVLSTVLSGMSLQSPVALSEDNSQVFLASGQVLVPSLDSLETGDALNIRYSGNLYNTFGDLLEVSNHVVGTVSTLDSDVSEDTLFVPNNALIIKERSSRNDNWRDNVYLLPPVAETDEILSLQARRAAANEEVFFVSKTQNRVAVESLLLTDADGDGMIGLFELINGLDDEDAGDRFEDPDGDFLSNIEEFKFASDPNQEDTDGDSWTDLEEFLNGSDPRDAASF